VITKLHEAKAIAVVAADPLALTLLKSPGEMGADVAVGAMLRFGMPMGYGGPHAGYIAARRSGPDQEEQAGGAQTDAKAAEEIWLCPRQARHR